MLGINTNSFSMSAQKNLGASMGGLQTSIDRLSSGLRVNSAKDDAAGLAISERMSAITRGNEVAKRNANDGISALQVADGGLANITDSLQRMRELATQSSNGTLTASDRDNLNAEYQQLSEEIFRKADTTEFNGVSLLKGDGAGGGFSLELQVGSKNTDQLTVGLGNISSEIQSLQSVKADATVAGTLANAVTLDDLGEVDVSASIPDLPAGFAAYDINDDGKADFQYNTTSGSLQTLKLDGSVDRDLTVATGGLANVAVSDVAPLDTDGNATIGSARLNITDDGTDSTVKFLNGDNIAGTDGSNAQSAIEKIDVLLDAVNTNRATIGAGINRLDSVISGLTTNITNLEAARGRIVDTDFAKETAKLTRSQILQQAGTAMLAQANQIPNNVLSLLR